MLTKHPLRFAAAITLTIATSVVALRSTLVVAESDSAITALTVAVGGETRTSMRYAAPAVVASDIAVLVDSTGSQSSFMAATSSLVVGAMNRLADPDNRVAVAASGDVPVFPFGVATDTPYRLTSPLSADRATWSAALTGLAAVEGGGDEGEGQLPALVQLLTNPVDDTPTDAPIEFASARRRVIVLTADHPPHLPADSWCRAALCVPYPGPSIERVRQVLADAAITLIVVSDGEVGVLADLAAQSGGAVIPIDGPNPATALDQALAGTRVALSPVLSGCEGITVRPANGAVLARAGEQGTSDVVFAAATGLALGTQGCTIKLGTLQHAVTVTAVAPCGEPTTTIAPATTSSSTTPSSTTPSSTAPASTTPSSTTTTAAPATTTVEPSTSTTTVSPTGDVTTTTSDPGASTSTIPSGPAAAAGPISPTTTAAGAAATTATTEPSATTAPSSTAATTAPSTAVPSATVAVASTTVAPSPCSGPLPVPTTTAAPPPPAPAELP